MNFFKNFVGGYFKSSEEKLAEKDKLQEIKRKIGREKAMLSLLTQIRQLENKARRLRFQLDCLKKGAQECINHGEKQQAHKCLVQATKVNKKIQQIIAQKLQFEKELQELQKIDMEDKILQSIKIHYGEHYQSTEKLKEQIKITKDEISSQIQADTNKIIEQLKRQLEEQTSAEDLDPTVTNDEKKEETKDRLQENLADC